MVFISLLLIGAVSASEAVSDLIEMSDVKDVQTIESDLIQDDDLLDNDYDCDDEVLSIEELEATDDPIESPVVNDIPLAENANVESVVGIADNDVSLENANDEPVLAESKKSKIDVYVDGKFLNSFNYTHGENGFTFAEMMDILNMSKVDMSSFGNFAEMFAMFNNFNFTDDSEKIFDFKIDGEVGKIKYNLGILSNSTDFHFDYSIVYPNQNNKAVTGKVISVYADGEFVKNLTFTSKGGSAFDFADMMNMASMSNIDMSQYMSMFNSTGSGESKNFDFKIAGEVGVVKYNLLMVQSESGFVFDYKISYPIINVVLTAKSLTTTAFNYKIDGKIGKYLSVTLKDVWGQALANKIVQISLNGNLYRVKTNSKGIAKLQINFAKAGVYPCTICFLGDEIHPAVNKLIKVIVKKQKAKLTTYKKKYNVKSKSKKLKAKFLTAKGKAIKGKKIIFKVKGKKYSAKTNKKGIATVKVKISKKGKYTFYAKFAGDNTYKAISKKSKLIIK